MATAVGHGHGSPVGAVAAASGSSAAAALPAIGVSGLPAGAGGTISPLGRERSSLTSIGGPPRKEASYASSTASKISIATLPLDTLEHIFDDFRAHQHHGAKNHANGGNRGGRGGGGPAVRISTTVAAGGGGGGGGGRSSVRTWNPVPGGGSGAATAGPTRRSHGNVGSLSFHFAAKPTTPPGNGPGGVLPGVLMQPPVLPGLPPGAPISLSSRAAAVLQVPESAAHLQRFIALDSAQLENHFIIANPNGATVTDLQEVIDNASSIDGLPSGREAVVLLTTTADGVPVPRIVPLDQPVPGGLRRAGMGHARGASATGLGTVDALLLDGAVRLSNSSASLLMGGQGSMVDVSAGYEGGGGGGGTEGEAVTPTNAGNGSFARAGSNPILVPVPPLSPQRSMAALYSPRRGGTPPARRSDNGMPRGAPYTSTVRMSSVTMLGPGRPSSPPLRSTAGIAMQGNGPQFNTLPALGEGGGAASARRSAPRRRGSASALIRREASSDAVAQSLPVLVRTTSPDRSNLAVSIVTADVGFGSVDGGVDLMAASPINSCSVHPGGGGAGAGASTRPRSGAVDGAQDLSPTRSRLHARIVTLQTERSSNQLMQSAQVQRQPSPLQPRGGGRNGASRSTIIMSGLSGMELVRAALKQVETGERTLVDPLVRISCNGASEGSRRASHSSVTTTCSGLGSGVGGGSEVSQSGAAPVPMLDTAALAEEAAREEEEEREATERRQARLVKSLTMLLTTGRRDGRASRPSSAASRLSRHSSIVLVQEADDADNEDVGSDVGSSLNGEDEDLQHRTGDGHSQQPSGDGSTSTSSQPPQPSRESSQQHLRVPKSATFKHDHRRYNRFRSRLHAGSRQPSEMSNLGGHARSLRSSRDSDGDSDTLEAAVAIAADGGLDPQALVEFAQQLDKANEEFRLVESPRLDLITPRPPVRRHASFPRYGRRREVVSEGEREEKTVYQGKDEDGEDREDEAEFFGLHLFPRPQPLVAFPLVCTAGFSSSLGFFNSISASFY
ncbi:hypothetical protein Vafri_4623 [Volvox africanus]|uniref:Uncharacterized protein n=1 Tax=Volvox africanus TaxID=51714 RepID=A0A8J4AUT4_9CHLO|nr:hypothetical protein Vafri_4623 [Volvox africanus]